MKKTFTLILLLSCGLVNAQWYQTMGPGPSNVTSVTIDGNALYVSTNGNGVHISPDSGASWHSANLNLPAIGVSSLYEKNGTILIGINSTIYKSADYGNTWAPTPASGSFKKFYTINDTLYALGSALQRTTNLGKTWTSVSYPNNSYGNIGAFYKKGNLILCGVDQYGMFRSADNGKSWTKTNKGLDTTKSNTVYVSNITAYGNTLYAGAGNGISGGGKLYTSIDDGLSWTPITAPFTTSPNGIIFLSNKIFISSNGLYSADIAGVSWVKLLPKIPSGNDFFSGLYTNGTDLYATMDNGFQQKDVNIFKSVDNGVTWKPVMSGVTAKLTNNLVFSGDTIYGSNGIVSYNNGNTWKLLSPVVPNGVQYSIKILGKKGNKLFANSAGTTVNAGIIVSTDNYKTWQVSNTGMYQYASISKMYVKNDSIFVSQSLNSTFGSEAGIYFSANNGVTWKKAANTGLIQAPVDFSISGNYLYAASTNGGVYVSTNSGANWTRMTSPAFASGNSFNMIQAIGDTVYTNGYNTLYRSLDKGATWTQLSGTALPTNTGNTNAITRIGNKLYASVDYKGVFTSDNNGASWVNLVDGFPANTSIFNLTSNKGRLFAMGDALYQRPQTGSDPIILSVSNSDEIAENELVLYPNPTQGLLNLNLNGDEERIIIANSFGEKVEEFTLKGQNQMMVDIKGYNTGLYFVTIVSGKKTSTIKVLKNQ